ncbi:MAG TPA: hypothetical protein VGA37_02650 [Gemmatimonadales bacterium]
MPQVPDCRRLGRHCVQLAVTAQVADIRDDTPTDQDAAATWLLGHTERITFGRPYTRGRLLVADAVVSVPCKYLEEQARSPNGSSRPAARCRAHGFEGPMPRPAPVDAPVLRHRADRFTIVHGRRVRPMALPLKRAARRALPVLQNGNPCVGAPCRTADNKMGAACCRDLTLEMTIPEGDPIEALLRARRPPYLCKVKRTAPSTVECEVISACGYLGDDDISCMLHDRVRPNGRPAKPDICSNWPEFDDDDELTGHPGCVFIDD